MIKNIITYPFQFVLFVLLQVLILNNIQLGGTINPFLYILYFIYFVVAHRNEQGLSNGNCIRAWAEYRCFYRYHGNARIGLRFSCLCPSIYVKHSRTKRWVRIKCIANGRCFGLVLVYSIRSNWDLFTPLFPLFC